MTSERLTKLQRALEQAGLDAAAIIPGPTLAHLTGVSFHLMERPIVLLVSRGRDPALVLPEFEKTKAALIPFKVNAFTYAEDPSGWESVFKTAVAALRLDGKRIGVEPRQMRLLEFRHVRAGAPGAEFPDASEALASLRLRKDETEVAAMRQAVRVAQGALEAMLPGIKIGATEREVASLLTMELLRQGSDSELPLHQSCVLARIRPIPTRPPRIARSSAETCC